MVLQLRSVSVTSSVCGLYLMLMACLHMQDDSLAFPNVKEENYVVVGAHNETISSSITADMQIFFYRNSISAPQQPFHDSRLLIFFLFSPAASGWPGNGKKRRNADTSERLQSITEAFALLGSMSEVGYRGRVYTSAASAKPNHSISH